MYYIDYNRNKYLTIEEYYKNISIGTIKSKELLKSKKLIILKNKEKIYENTNIQSLYLYPLNIIDYIKYAYMKDTVMYNILYIDIDKINKFNFKNIKNIEFIINDKTRDKIDTIINLSRNLKKNNKYVSYNLKTLNIDKEKFRELSSIGDYFKIHLDNIIGKSKYTVFLKQIKLLKNYVNEDAVIHIKSYLNVEQVKYYKKAIKELGGLADIFQVSKELMPSDMKENIKIESPVQKEIRDLEKNNDMFISVRDISTLYYPRFELDERNTHHCRACYLKPYIFKDKILPCKVTEVINNIEERCIDNLKFKIDSNKIKNKGKECKDCASIFENDTIDEILRISEENYDFLLEIDE